MYLRNCGKNPRSCTLSLCEEIGFEYRSLFPKIKSRNLKSVLEKSMTLCSIYSYYRRNVCVQKMNNLSDKLWKLEISPIAPLNACGEFRWSPEGSVSQIHSPHLHVGAPGIFSHLLRSVQILKRVGCGKQWEATASIHPQLNCT